MVIPYIYPECSKIREWTVQGGRCPYLINEGTPGMGGMWVQDGYVLDCLNGETD